MLLVTVEVIGADGRQRVEAVRIVNRGPTAASHLADGPEDERWYRVERVGRGRRARQMVTHRRGDGALVLATKALAALTAPEDETPGDGRHPQVTEGVRGPSGGD